MVTSARPRNLEKRVAMRAWVMNIRPLLCGAALILLLCPARSAGAQQQSTPAAEDVDHAGLIGAWTDANRARGSEADGGV